jgi:ribose-phosphate pyrophosphokinase
MEKRGFKMFGELAIISGRGNPALAKDIAESLQVPLLETEITAFDNENIFVQLKQSVRAQDVFIIQPTCSPVNDNLVELLILLDTVRRASAGRITAVMPFFAYARSDKKDMPRVPITARLIADMISTAGADRFMTVDLHAGQIQGFFNITGDELTVFPLLSRYFSAKQIPDLTVVAADLGFAKKARNFAEALGVPVAFVEKRRKGPQTEDFAVIGEVKGCNVLIVDDEVDRGTTMCDAAHILRDNGAKDVYACFVHATFSDGAAERMRRANFKEVVCTDTQPITEGKQLPNMTVIHLGPWLARIIDAVHRGLSVGKALKEYQQLDLTID